MNPSRYHPKHHHCPDCDGQLIRLQSVNHDLICMECGQEWGSREIDEMIEELNQEEGEVDFNVPFDPAYSLTGDEQVSPQVDASTTPTTMFPYDLADLQYWIIKRKSGEHVKWSLIPDGAIKGKDAVPSSWKAPTVHPAYHLSDLCDHNLTPLPVYERDGIRLFICDCWGAKKDREKVDFVIDGGDVISEYLASSTAILSGDRALAQTLSPHMRIAFKGPRVLKIAWGDRKAPFLAPSFWVELVKELKGDVMTCCQGGHGRSGTSLVCLMMVLNPDYGAKDAIVHLRAIHCPRAIEGADQHAYINEVAGYLGRAQDADGIHQVTNFKEEFMKMTYPSCKPYQDRLQGQTPIKTETGVGGQV